jgi:hydroxymethylglutaryl-CoA reductase (NADPH)
MVTLTRAGGAAVRVHVDENRVSPVFFFPGVGGARDFARDLPRHLDALRRAAESTTRHGKLLRVECQPVGREVIVNFCYHTADAQGMNMIVKATDAACRWLRENTAATGHLIFSGYNSEKRASGSLLAGGKGKKVVAGALIPARLVRTFLRVAPEELFRMWQETVIGHFATGSLGYNGHLANGLAALFVATGQDVANVANSAVGITRFELTADGDVYASVTLPSLSVATVGGGTGLGTSRECLEMLGCAGSGKALKLAEITAATLLAGEISFGAAIAAGGLVAAHETYGRNPPPGGGP